MYLVPSEVNIFGVYLPPLLLAAILGTVAAVLSAYLLNRYRLSRFFYFPPLVFLALTAIYTSLIGTFVIPV
jgi:energy-converting hydrogenase Eha subunit A